MAGMAKSDSSSQGTMLMSALLVLALLFAGAWIYVTAEPGDSGMWLVPWFGGAAAIVIVIGFIKLLRARGDGGGS